MPLVAVRGDPNTGGGGNLISENPQTVFVNTIPVIEHQDPAEPDGSCPGANHCNPKTAEGSPDVFVYFNPLHRHDDDRICGHLTVVVNQNNVFANDPGQVGFIEIQGRRVYGNTPESIAALKKEESSVSPNLPTYHEDEPGSVTPATTVTATNASGAIITIPVPPIQSPPASVQKDPERPAVPPEGCKNSKYYILADAKMAIKEQVGLTKEQIECNWIALCTNILDKLRDAGFTFKINSGFRTIEYNRSIGSSDSSDHTSGCATDISTGSQEGNKALFKELLNRYPYSQLIFEGNWVHVAYNGKSPKGGAKVMYTYTGSSPKSAGASGEYLPGDLRTA